MKLDELLRYITERGAQVNVQDGRLWVRGMERLTPLCKQVLYDRRAEIYHRFGLPLAGDSNTPLESCPHCGKPLTAQDNTF